MRFYSAARYFVMAFFIWSVPTSGNSSREEAACQEAAELMFKFGPMLHEGTVTLEMVEKALGYPLPTSVRLVVKAALMRYEELVFDGSDLERRATTYDICIEYLD